MRFAALAASLVGSVVFAVLIPFNAVFVALFALCAILSAIGIWDLLQSKHSVRRNYPILANIRFMLEKIRPEIRQYFLESETDGTPFNRSKRAVAYQRAKGALDKRPFGTQQDIYGNNFEWINHSIVPCPVEGHDFRITVGGADCRKPYALSLFNISAMSFGALSANAIRSLNRGAKLGGFAHDTGEGGISRYLRLESDRGMNVTIVSVDYRVPTATPRIARGAAVRNAVRPPAPIALHSGYDRHRTATRGVPGTCKPPRSSIPATTCISHRKRSAF